METLLGKNALVVGATGGIGSEVAKLLKQSGANVFLLARDSAKLAALATEMGIPAAHTFVADVSKAADVARAIDAFHALVPRADILINAVGVGIIRPIENLTLEDLEKTLASNLIAPFLLMKTLLPPMKTAGKGLIINVTGVLGKTPMAGAAAYSASKYGLVGMMKSIREELKRTEIRITDVYLGGTDTPFWDSDVEIRFQREKFISAKEAARAIWFLCQQPSSGVVSEMVLQPFNHQAI